MENISWLNVDWYSTPSIRRMFCLPISCPLVSLSRPIARPRLVSLHFPSYLVLFALLWRSESTIRSICSRSWLRFAQSNLKHRWNIVLAWMAFYSLCTISVTIVYESHKSCQVYLFPFMVDQKSLHSFEFETFSLWIVWLCMFHDNWRLHFKKNIYWYVLRRRGRRWNEIYKV